MHLLSFLLFGFTFSNGLILLYVLVIWFFLIGLIPVLIGYLGYLTSGLFGILSLLNLFLLVNYIDWLNNLFLISSFVWLKYLVLMGVFNCAKILLLLLNFFSKILLVLLLLSKYWLFNNLDSFILFNMLELFFDLANSDCNILILLLFEFLIY